jgi:uncharacterized protein (DUF362 family)
MLLYHLSRRSRWRFRYTFFIGAVISILIFVGVSTLLYLDIIYWPLPYREGSVWMFHTLVTGIQKADVPVFLVILMFLLYPVWHSLGYIFALRQDLGAFLFKTISFESVKSHRGKVNTAVSVRRGPLAKKITREAVNAVGGMASYVKEGDKVLIKPNICGGNPEIVGSFTSHEVIEELVVMVREAKGEPFVADADMIWTQFEPVAEEQGWLEWAKRVNVPLLNLTKTDRVFFDFGKDSATGIVPVSKELVDADVIISAPTMKTHLLTSITMGMKNMYGTFPQQNKGKYHRFGIEEVIYEVNKAFTPSLTVIDGTVGGDAWGPLSCTPVNSETVIASNDVVAADAVACQIMGYDPLSIIHIKRAHEKGLGDANYVYNFTDLPYSHPKDGNWTKPDPEVSIFYEGLIEYFLLLPGMQRFFDIIADYVLYDTATTSLLKDLTPEVEGVLNDVLGMILRNGIRGSEWKEGDIDKFKERIEYGLKAGYKSIMDHIDEIRDDFP